MRLVSDGRYEHRFYAAVHQNSQKPVRELSLMRWGLIP